MRTVNLKIEDIAFGGKGIGREAGKVIFVPYTIEQETVSVEIVREKKQFAEAELLEVRDASPHRVAPPCPYFGRCGGCSYQHIDYGHQVAIKWRQVRDVLQRIGKLKDIPMRPIIPSPIDYHYRNRITVHAQDGVIGFFRRDSRHLIDIEQCPISTDEVNRALQELRAESPRDGHYTLRSRSAPRIFSQTNDAMADALRNLVAGMVPRGQELLIDAYCGAGFFAKALLDKAERIIGIDWDRFAIEEARKNATDKETYLAGDVEEQLLKVAAVHRTAISRSDQVSESSSQSMWPVRSTAATCLIVDPPATGLTDRVLQSIVELAAATLIYVSCSPATLARDLKNLMPHFKLQSVTPLDMFPQTAEIEVVVDLMRTA